MIFQRIEKKLKKGFLKICQKTVLLSITVLLLKIISLIWKEVELIIIITLMPTLILSLPVKGLSKKKAH